MVSLLAIILTDVPDNGYLGMDRRKPGVDSSAVDLVMSVYLTFGVDHCQDDGVKSNG